MKLRNEETKAGTLVVDTHELASLLGVSKRHIERMDAAGKLPKPKRLGRTKRWLRAEIDRWVETGYPDRRTWEALRGGAR
jgi:excisionase family DNA binding protein